ncbi:Membrane protein [Lasiodiplodia theobromae]|uniref:Membrane protein n=1 Tax=Lasiodiplodia theobromae TaxID=45133 RepID=UPI0015C3DB5E|nr:Membrane protein [Lasiodiplodia theobromae]KAF4543192.1 Membrane protein [Lasiodiplodia theobromae]
MSNRQAVARRAAADEQQMNDYAPPQQVEAREQYARAEAKAGLNLNIFAALSGSMFQRKTKTTDTAADGSSRVVEQTDTAARGKGAAHGNLSAYGAARAEGRDRAIGQESTRALAEDGRQRKKALKEKGEEVGRKAKEAQVVDHLGIGAWEVEEERK